MTKKSSWKIVYILYTYLELKRPYSEPNLFLSISQSTLSIVCWSSLSTSAVWGSICSKLRRGGTWVERNSKKDIHTGCSKRISRDMKQEFSPNMNRCNNVNVVDSILGEHLWFFRKFSAFYHSTISSSPKKGVKSPKAFIFLTSHWMN